MTGAISLERIDTRRMPLRYGSAACCLTLSDSRYTADIVNLRNNSEVNRFIHHDHLTPESHERWLRGESMRRDSLNFVILVAGHFAGTASLYRFVAGANCEFGRMVMPNDDRRIYAVAVEFLCLSFAFEILQAGEVYCTVAGQNTLVYEFHLRNGWKRDPRHDGFTRINGSETAEFGLSMSYDDWKKAMENNRDLLRRLHRGGDPNLD
jgi:RimJ/RimL family protein N-acetyltransferase